MTWDSHTLYFTQSLHDLFKLAEKQRKSRYINNLVLRFFSVFQNQDGGHPVHKNA